MAAGGQCLRCELYRAEPGFLLQGVMGGLIPPNTETVPGPKIMERGEVGWAGGAAGPDFFIYLGTSPAAHWKHDHTVFAEARETAPLVGYVGASLCSLTNTPPRAPFPPQPLRSNALPPRHVAHRVALYTHGKGLTYMPPVPQSYATPHPPLCVCPPFSTRQFTANGRLI